MTKSTESQHDPSTQDGPAHRIRLPTFIIEETVGLGDLVHGVTSYFGIRSCGSCERRKATLNKWLVFSKSRER
jgi:hypothetical protein